MYTAEPQSVVLKLDSIEVGQMVVADPSAGIDGIDSSGEQVEVQLGQSYVVECIVTGGNRPPSVTLAKDDVPFEGVMITKKTERDPADEMSVPHHVVTVNLLWTPTINDIARPFFCSARVEDLKAVSTNFMPIVADSKLCRNCTHQIICTVFNTISYVYCRG